MSPCSWFFQVALLSPSLASAQALLQLLKAGYLGISIATVPAAAPPHYQQQQEEQGQQQQEQGQDKRSQQGEQREQEEQHERQQQHEEQQQEQQQQQPAPISPCFPCYATRELPSQLAGAVAVDLLLPPEATAVAAAITSSSSQDLAAARHLSFMATTIHSWLLPSPTAATAIDQSQHGQTIESKMFGQVNATSNSTTAAADAAAGFCLWRLRLGFTPSGFRAAAAGYAEDPARKHVQQQLLLVWQWLLPHWTPHSCSRKTLAAAGYSMTATTAVTAAAAVAGGGGGGGGGGHVPGSGGGKEGGGARCLDAAAAAASGGGGGGGVGGAAGDGSGSFGSMDEHGTESGAANAAGCSGGGRPSTQSIGAAAAGGGLGLRASGSSTTGKGVGNSSSISTSSSGVSLAKGTDHAAAAAAEEGEGAGVPFDAAQVYAAVKPRGDEPRYSQQPPQLLPQLRPYQQRALYWMLQRERAPKSSSSSSSRGVIADDTAAATSLASAVGDSMGCVNSDEALHPLWSCVTPLPPVNFTVGSSETTGNFTVKSSSGVDEGGSVFYVNPYSGLLSHRRFPAPPPVRGGILCEEMGLGKTVELLACIMTNRAPRIEGVDGMGVEVSKQQRQQQVMGEWVGQQQPQLQEEQEQQQWGEDGGAWGGNGVKQHSPQEPQQQQQQRRQRKRKQQLDKEEEEELEMGRGQRHTAAATAAGDSASGVDVCSGCGLMLGVRVHHPWPSHLHGTAHHGRKRSKTLQQQQQQQQGQGQQQQSFGQGGAMGAAVGGGGGSSSVLCGSCLRAAALLRVEGCGTTLIIVPPAILNQVSRGGGVVLECKLTAKCSKGISCQE